MKGLSSRSYKGQVRLVIFDWAGTTVDYGSCAPAAAFIEGFKRHGVPITMAQARAHMGMEKRDHIKEIGQLPSVAQSWQNTHGRPMDAADVDILYEDFASLLCAVLAEHCEVIAGVGKTVRWLREKNIKIGASTGYFKEAAEIVAKCAAKQGYSPDFSICATEVPAGRPSPWMIYRVMEKLQIFPPEAVVHVGDTVVDVQAALNAGVWAVGVACTGNLGGMSLAGFTSLPADERQELTNAARRTLRRAGAHFVIDSIAEIPQIINNINNYIAKQEGFSDLSAAQNGD